MNFQNKIPREYAEKLTEFLGPPTIVGKNIVGWENVPKPYIRVEVKDEYIVHNFPVKHHDFVYSYITINLSSKIAGKLLSVSGSILIDLLKNEVGARCGSLNANDVTLNFVEDVKKEQANATKREYARRIKGKIITREKKYHLSKQFSQFLEKDDREECIII